MPVSIIKPTAPQEPHKGKTAYRHKKMQYTLHKN
jgi:hypothetical protein